MINDLLGDRLFFPFVLACVVGIGLAGLGWICRAVFGIKPRVWELSVLGGGTVGYLATEKPGAALEIAALIIVGYFLIRIVGAYVYEAIVNPSEDEGTTCEEKVVLRSTEGSAPCTNETVLMLSRLSSFVDSACDYDVYVDDQLVRTIGPGGQVKLVLSPGQHQICLRLEWVGSNELEIDARRSRALKATCGSSLTGARIMLLPLYALLWRNRAIWIKLATEGYENDINSNARNSQPVVSDRF